MRNTVAKLKISIFKSIFAFNVTFLNKSYGDTKQKKMRYLKPDSSPK